MHPLVNIGVRAARAAGNVILRNIERLDTVKVTEKAANDFVSEVDQEAERVIIQTIRKAYPSHAVLGEESGRHAGDDFLWIIDPLDGTTNYLHGFPQYAVSIALSHKGRTEHGVVFDPLRRELFTASRGAGARLDDKRIRVSTRAGLAGSLLGTGFPFRDGADMERYLATLGALMPLVAGIRRAGAASLDLACVACGRLDAFWEFGLGPWDVAAGALLVQEAGGLVTDPLGAEGWMATGDIAAGAPKVMRELLGVVCESLAIEPPASVAGRPPRRGAPPAGRARATRMAPARKPRGPRNA